MYISSDVFTLVRASIKDPNIPDGAYIIDSNGKAYVAFDKQGRIRLLDSVSFQHDTDIGTFGFVFQNDL